MTEQPMGAIGGRVYRPPATPEEVAAANVEPFEPEPEPEPEPAGDDKPDDDSAELTEPKPAGGGDDDSAELTEPATTSTTGTELTEPATATLGDAPPARALLADHYEYAVAAAVARGEDEAAARERLASKSKAELMADYGAAGTDADEA